MRRLACFLGSQFATVHESPIIVLGNQKSGTSAIAHLLADFGGLSKTIDIPALWPPVGVEIMRGQADFASIVGRHSVYFSTELIKEPMMTFFTDQVLEVFPRAKYVFVIRDPRDNIRSLLNRRHIPGHLREIEEGLIPVSPQHSVVADASVWGGESENYVGVLAHRWNKAADSYFRYQDRMTLARYEDFMSDKSEFVAGLAGSLGISKKNDISDKVDVQYQQRGNRDVSWEEFFRLENLLRIEWICSSRMKELGYMLRGNA